MVETKCGVYLSRKLCNRPSGCMFRFPNEVAHLFVINSALMLFKVEYSCKGIQIPKSEKFFAFGFWNPLKCRLSNQESWALESDHWQRLESSI